MKIRHAASAATALAFLAACSPETLIEEAAEKAIENEIGEDIEIDSDNGNFVITGEDGEKVEINSDDGKITVTDEDGETVIDQGGNALADGWPEQYSLPSGSSIISSLRIEDTDEGTVTYNASFQDADSFDDAEALFRSFGATPTLDSLNQVDGTRTLILGFEGDDDITVFLNEGPDGTITGNLTIQQSLS